ncbi:MAG: PIN domain-containing protein [Microbacterium sp.]
MASRERAFLDTNVLVYAYEPDAGPRHEVAATLLDGLGRSRRATLSVQVMLEFHNTMTRRMRHVGYTPDVARRLMQRFSRWPTHSPVAEDVVAAVALSHEAQLSIWDAMIVRSAQQMGCGVLWTEDLSHGQVIEGVEIRSPFRELT